MERNSFCISLNILVPENFPSFFPFFFTQNCYKVATWTNALRAIGTPASTPTNSYYGISKIVALFYLVSCGSLE